MVYNFCFLTDALKLIPEQRAIPSESFQFILQGIKTHVQ